MLFYYLKKIKKLQILIYRIFKNKWSNEMFSGTFIASSMRVLSFFTSYILLFSISNLYGADATGIFALFQTSLLLLSLISRLGLDTASIKFISKSFFDKKFLKLKIIYFKILKIIFFQSLLIGLLFYLFSSFIVLEVFSKPNLISTYKLLSFFIFPMSIIYLHSENFRAIKKVLFFSIFHINLITPLISTILLIYLYTYAHYSIFNPVYAYLFSLLMVSIISFLFWYKKMPKISNEEQNIFCINYKELLTVSVPMFLTSSLHFILQWISIFILSIYCSDWQLGIYDVTVKIALIASISIFGVNAVVVPKFVETFHSGNMVKFKKIIFDSTKLIFWLSIPILIFIIVFSDHLLNLFGPEFIYGKNSLLILVIGQFFNSISGSVGYILQMTGKEIVFRNIMIFTSIVCIILNFIFIPYYGIIGAALATTLCQILWNTLSILVIKKEYKILTLYYPGRKI